VSHFEFSVTDLELLVGLAEGLTLAEIARRRWVTHSALSRALHTLERRVGLRLVERSGRRIRLTADGWELAREARKAVEQLQRVRQAAQAIRRGEAGLLRILASATPADYLLPSVIGGFVREVPSARISVRVADLLALHEELCAGDYDVAIGPSEPVPPGWIAVPLYVDELVFFVGRGHRWAGRPVPWETVRTEILVGALARAAWHRLWARVAHRPFDAEWVVEVRSAEAVKRVVGMGCGVGILPKSAIRKELASGQLAEIRIPGMLCELPYALFAQQGRRSALVDRFREAVFRYLETEGLQVSGREHRDRSDRGGEHRRRRQR
jgi:DNA-binding transcriptional LysR family regulator